MSTLDPHREALTLCTFCPSLCHHACPVTRVEARDAVSPWALMSLARHVAVGDVRLTEEVAEVFYHCTGCGACTDACLHGNDVASALVAARAHAVSRGRAPFGAERFLHTGLREHQWWTEGSRARARFRREPAVVLVPGHTGLLQDPTPVETLLGLCERVDEDELACGDASHLVVGYDLWASGYHDAFRERAAEVQHSLAHANHVVVMSGEALFTLATVYPRFGFPIEPQILSTSEFLQPILSGAGIERVPGRIALHESCHVSRLPGRVDAARAALERVLDEPLIQLSGFGGTVPCCGGTGCLPATAPRTAAEMAEEVVAGALRTGVDKLATFAVECLESLRGAAGDRLEVVDAVELIDEAITGEYGRG